MTQTASARRRRATWRFHWHWKPPKFISLALEAAEILEHFQFRESAKDQQELAGELADVALYLLQLASVTRIDLEQAILDKIEINKTREWTEE
jgi:NTP pyrophosphatase (non-canonical NTP hydrolase)